MPGAAVTITAPESPAPEDLQAIEDGLERHNLSAAPLGEVKPLAVLARDASGRLIGGATGRWWGACCELLQLWVDESHRSQGVGSRLVREFEAQGRSRGCRIFYLTTLSYQAPDFYRRLGYVALAEITGYPLGIAKYLMHKVEP